MTFDEWFPQAWSEPTSAALRENLRGAWEASRKQALVEAAARELDALARTCQIPETVSTNPSGHQCTHPCA
jgi:hypothetical protein